MPLTAASKPMAGMEREIIQKKGEGESLHPCRYRRSYTGTVHQRLAFDISGVRPGWCESAARREALRCMGICAAGKQEHVNYGKYSEQSRGLGKHAPLDHDRLPQCEQGQSARRNTSIRL